MLSLNPSYKVQDERHLTLKFYNVHTQKTIIGNFRISLDKISHLQRKRGGI